MTESVHVTEFHVASVRDGWVQLPVQFRDEQSIYFAISDVNPSVAILYSSRGIAELSQSTQQNKEK